MDLMNIHASASCIVNRVLRSAGLPVEYGNHPAGVTHHPLVPALICSDIVSGADVLYEICLLQQFLIRPFPVSRPAILEAPERDGSDEVEGWIVFP